MKKFLLIGGILILLLPIFSAIAPVMFIGNIFTNAWGTLKDFTSGMSSAESNYDGNFTNDLDQYQSENKISLNYKQIVTCVLADTNGDPRKCYENHDEYGNITTKSTNTNDFWEVDWPEWNGTIDQTYFKQIHVLGKYTTTNWEIVGYHTETTRGSCVLNSSSGSKVVDDSYCERGIGGSSYGASWKTSSREVPDYDWVYHPTIKRGKCEETEEQKCNVILEDKDVYPFQWPTYSLTQRYGIQVDKEAFTIDTANYQIWSGQSLYAFSKAKIEEIDDKHVKLKILANDIDLYALYEASGDATIISNFGKGDIVEATEEFARNEGEYPEMHFYIFNSSGQYINPYIYFDTQNLSFANLGTIIYGFENFVPDFTNEYAWKTGNGYYPTYCGQCTWFAKGMFIQIYGFNPNFTGNGNVCASQAHKFLGSQGWTLTKSPSPGAIFSKLGGEFGHVGIVCGVNEDNSIVVVDGNYDGENNTFEEFISMPDWNQRTIPYSVWYEKYEFCNPPQ